ncbi:MAG TPA: tRNA lysidine(34) synthetase TilS [Candidatus Saccharibacteria bacterium]|nr:tRNA lysidine(34) synthetase TilS [Candidatus Saccharibacteria bacterium]
MKISVIPGKYIVAVSGGVDSVVLLDLLSKNKNLDLVVAHFDHGIRQESANDADFVTKLAKKYGLKIILGKGKLGSDVSEDEARKARYDFLFEILMGEGAKAIITAHHQDDVVETVIFNILRGTGRKGVTALSNQKQVLRPLLNVTKKEITEYARDNKLTWVEDSTNLDTKYTRNWIRHVLLPKMGDDKKEQIVQLYKSHQPINDEVDELITAIMGGEKSLEKLTLLNLPYSISCEVVASWLRKNGLAEFDKKTIDRIVRGASTLPVGKTIDIYGKTQVRVGKKFLGIIKR